MPKFPSNEVAIEHYSKEISTVAAANKVSVSDLFVMADKGALGVDESFRVHGLFSTLRALKETK